MAEDDSTRTMIWRRPGAASGTPGQRPSGEPGWRREPVRPGEITTNLNQPNAGYPPYPAVSPVRLAVWRAQRIIYYVFGVVEAFIAIRFLLRVLAANPGSPFTHWVYTISWVFAFPFNGVLPDAVAGASVIEWFSLIGLLVYALVSVALAALIGLLI
jgi:hypothetical protein